MSETTRRGFVKDSAAAAAGVTVIGALLAEQAEAHATGASRPLVAYVRNVRKGEIWVMAGDRDIRVHDRKLAAHIARVAHHHHRAH
jgi:hypothetical protein